ncbi:hypothetical protein, partial [Gemmatimonas sp.]|uniref:hypothetical protein n=1 Tax=Gemmatimonas sp. TaxID=1962908 RepID=UPI003F720BA1
MHDRLPSRITISATAAHYGRSRRWVRLHVSALSEAAQAALQPGTYGPRHEREFDRAALFAHLDHVLGVSKEAASARLRHLARYVGNTRRRDEAGAALCECVFRSKRPPNPIQFGQAFWFNSATA